jgi:hypothetical protein
MNLLPRERLFAPMLHGFVFILTWVLFWLQPQPLLDGPSRWPFALVFVADLPFSAIAFGVMFSSESRFPYAVAAWGIVGTIWWYWLGRSIEAWVRRFRNRQP